MVKVRIKKGDTVKVRWGKDRGKTGTVMQVMPSEGRVLVEGIQLVKKHVKARQQGQKSQRVDVASPIALAKVQLVCPKCGTPTRVGRVQRGDMRERVCRKCTAALP